MLRLKRAVGLNNTRIVKVQIACYFLLLLGCHIQLKKKTKQIGYIAFEYKPIDTVNIPIYDLTDDQPDIVITPNGSFAYYGSNSNTINIFNRKTNNFISYQLNLNNVALNLTHNYQKIDKFSFINDSIVILSIYSKNQKFADKSVLKYNLMTGNILSTYNFRKSGLLNSDEFTMDSVKYNPGLINKMNVIFNYGNIDFYNRLDSSIIVQIIGTVNALDKKPALAKNNFIKLYEKSTNRYPTYLNIKWLDFNNSFLDIPSHGPLSNYFNYIPMYTRVSDSCILVTYKFSHEILLYNVYDYDVKWFSSQPAFIIKSNLCFPDSLALNLRKNFKYSQRTFYNNIDKYFHRIAYLPAPDSTYLSDPIPNTLIDLVLDSNLIPIGIVQCSDNKKMIAAQCINGNYFGYAPSLRDKQKKTYTLIKYKIVNLGRVNGYFTLPKLNSSIK